ncbi:GNAT family N-acetyltransferase [Pseudomonas sp. CCI3.2]|uniref:GNAT family N-acetyltransferase n=1 Tax=unclassified Pseudomonas TaxID=196821 RepID=UPI002AC9660C|nr:MULTISPECIES: GNAT family N-acetyltransferase [unclassified Pseudomonas]MEB0075798.1 GNAT family N-acetyltransferase [Pseudomonas sp. MH10out]MEB0091733.1 GNAT family N-acetyltransferase [Pseudomonas sp. CCI4.2]MEB0099725.1 GNAT family N-acetyltransferase [Pseudomonas sp. CCI3.2]MEB0122128.1 GNAT family N-acetyltransferase [Pseudomonas sp. CCI1.2]MEB0131552.1 GNAT family N-acetyltransferase [Pseudomonas sp. CCI2.4]
MGRTGFQLHTERLLIRELKIEDVPALAAILGDAQVMRHSVGGVMTEKETREFVAGCVFSYQANDFGPWAVIDKATTTFIGFCGLNAEPVEGAEEVEIGYRLSREFWGKGLATEAAMATRDYAFATLGIDSLIAIVEPENIASVNVIEKLGFNTFIHSQYHRRGVKIYRMTRHRWAERVAKVGEAK